MISEAETKAARWNIRFRITIGTLTSTLFISIILLIGWIIPVHAEPTCSFLIPDKEGNAIQGPSFEKMPDGFTRGILECGNETRHLLVITLVIDTSEPHIGVRDDPLFTVDVTGPLEPLDDIQIADHSNIHILGRVNPSPRIGVRRGYVRFATLCDADTITQPLNCSWGTSRIKFRSTMIDTNNDEVVDRSYHELSVYRSEGRLHMVTFWAPHRDHIKMTTDDWLSALHAFGVDVARETDDENKSKRG